MGAKECQHRDCINPRLVWSTLCRDHLTSFTEQYNKKKKKNVSELARTLIVLCKDDEQLDDTNAMANTKRLGENADEGSCHNFDGDDKDDDDDGERKGANIYIHESAHDDSSSVGSIDAALREVSRQDGITDDQEIDSMDFDQTDRQIEDTLEEIQKYWSEK